MMVQKDLLNFLKQQFDATERKQLEIPINDLQEAQEYWMNACKETLAAKKNPDDPVAIDELIRLFDAINYLRAAEIQFLLRALVTKIH
jgi:hypothetical protein